MQSIKPLLDSLHMRWCNLFLLVTKNRLYLCLKAVKSPKIQHLTLNRSFYIYVLHTHNMFNMYIVVVTGSSGPVTGGAATSIISVVHCTAYADPIVCHSDLCVFLCVVSSKEKLALLPFAAPLPQS